MSVYIYDPDNPPEPVPARCCSTLRDMSLRGYVWWNKLRRLWLCQSAIIEGARGLLAITDCPWCGAEIKREESKP